jgi:hypothetical protein
MMPKWWEGPADLLYWLVLLNAMRYTSSFEGTVIFALAVILMKLGHAKRVQYFVHNKMIEVMRDIANLLKP